MEKRTIVAIILSTVFLLAWFRFFPPKTEQKPIPVAETVKSTSTTTPLSAPIITTKKTADFTVTTGQPREIQVNTEAMRVIFTTLGAQPAQWYLKERKEEINLIITSPLKNQELWESNTENLNLNAGNPSGQIVFTKKQDGITVEKIYTFNAQGYWVDLNYKVNNNSSNTIRLPLSTGWESGLGTDKANEKENISLLRTLSFTNGKLKKLEPVKPGKSEEPDKFNYRRNFSWAGIDNRYFLVALFPQFDTEKILNVTKEEKLPSLTINWESSEIMAKSSKDYAFRIFIGPKQYYALKKLGLDLEKSVDFGAFGFFGKIIFETLTFLHKITNNYGWSIIILTLFLQILLSPLTIKSLKATQSMKKIQPQMKILQTKYKEDPKRMQQELVLLYKREGVNPFGGCLPLILQIPIFWALFTALRNAYDLRSAPFIFWIKDLSAFDPYYVLPILMGAVMFLQQKMTAVATDPTQAKMMYIMPVIFTFMFMHFPSGLVLYWFTNSLLTFLEQLYLMKRWEKAGIY